MAPSPAEPGQMPIDEDGGESNILQHTESMVSTLSSHNDTTPVSDGPSKDLEIWQGVKLVEDIPQHGFPFDPNEDSFQTWDGVSQTKDKPILMRTSDEEHFEETWSRISASVRQSIIHQAGASQQAPESVVGEWSGLSGDVEDHLEPVFTGISSQWLGIQRPAGQDLPEQVEGERKFFWSLRPSSEEATAGNFFCAFLFLFVLQASTPSKTKDTAKQGGLPLVELNDSDSSSDGAPRYYRNKKSADRINALLKQVPGIKHCSPDLLVLQRRVRERTKQILNRINDTPTLTGRPALLPTRFEVQRYESTKDPQHGPSIVTFKIEISDKCRTPWNKRLAVVFADDFIDNGKYGYTKNDHKKIVEVFLTHLKFLRINYVRSEDNPTPQVQLDEEKARARDARRRALHQRRLNICQHYIADASMQNLLDILKDVNYKICSGDESARDRGKMRYAIVQPIWRNPQLHFQFRILDRLHLSTRITEEDRFTRGAPPRVRVTADRVDHSEPLPGLPQNFYCPVYLAGLPQYKRDALNIQPPRKIFISQDIKRVADEHARLTSIETPVLPEHELLNSPFFYR